MKLALFAVIAALGISASLAAQSSDKAPAPETAKQSPRQLPPDPFANVPPARPDDVKSVDSILLALYDVISGPAGDRDWNRFRSLFIPTARLTSSAKGPDGVLRVYPNSVEDYVRIGGNYFSKNAFYEKPIVNRVQTFGNVAQVFSSYESRHAPADAPFARGINSLQLLNDGKRWWVINILWDEERPDNPLPKEFAAKP